MGVRLRYNKGLEVETSLFGGKVCIPDGERELKLLSSCRERRRGIVVCGLLPFAHLLYFVMYTSTEVAYLIVFVDPAARYNM